MSIFEIKKTSFQFYLIVFFLFSYAYRNNLGECLNDEPQETTYKGVTMLAGAVYDADYQCSLLYPNSTHCPVSPDEFCGV